MAVVLMGWDPERGTRWVPPYGTVVDQVAAGGRATVPWQLHGEHSPLTGTRVHLLLQGHERGLVGLGTVASGPFLSAAHAMPGTLATHVLITWQALLPVAERITPDELAVRVPGIAWDDVYGEVHVISPNAQHALERLWLAPHPAAKAGPSRRATASRLAAAWHVEPESVLDVRDERVSPAG